MKATLYMKGHIEIRIQLLEMAGGPEIWGCVSDDKLKERLLEAKKPKPLKFKTMFDLRGRKKQLDN